MKTAKVIIGGGFGDEGKGLFTDYHASQSDRRTCVVRFNGGAQAGHTVETPDGRRHVFSHFSSGSFAGLPSFLSRFFVCSPITFLREQKELAAISITPTVYADSSCAVTTPYDIMINQIVEHARGNRRHGSVGVGFGETIERHSNKNFALTLADITNTDSLRVQLDSIRLDWTYRRLAVLGVNMIGEEWRERLESEAIREQFLADVEQFLASITVVPTAYLGKWDHYVFEGAQGLLLDQTYGWFPHVTRSNTGIKNVISLAEEIKLKELDIYYLTRSYATRHGAGPLPRELAQQPYSKIVDQTNRPNPYQGSLRFAHLDLNLFSDTVRQDLTAQSTRIKLKPHLGMSCLDQIDDLARYFLGGEEVVSSPEALLEKARCSINAISALGSYGPTRSTICETGASAKSVFGWRYGALESFDVVKNDVLAVV